MTSPWTTLGVVLPPDLIMGLPSEFGMVYPLPNRGFATGGRWLKLLDVADSSQDTDSADVACQAARRPGRRRPRVARLDLGGQASTSRSLSTPSWSL